MFNLKNLSKGIAVPFMVLLILGMFVVPLAPPVIDALFVVNIVIALVILMAAVFSDKPLDFSSFPTVLLVATVMRLALNVASTRIILMNGHNGTGSSGRIIQAFGEFVIGGMFVVGAIVFAIITIINIMVVSKGTERVSEVSARFTLDALPGKQMAIDADLAAGESTQEQAAEARSNLAKEAQFYGAMDGVTKFVKGDAIAGILILAINICGGIAIGSMQMGMSFGEAISTYSILSIGDGLVAILPSILISLATAIIVTKINGEEPLLKSLETQLVNNPVVLRMAAIILVVFGLIPNMPLILFWAVAGVLFYFAERAEKNLAVTETSGNEPNQLNEQEELQKAAPVVSLADIEEHPLITIEMGYQVDYLLKRDVDDLDSAVIGMRKELSSEYGVLIGPVCYRNNHELDGDEYRILIKGIEKARSFSRFNLMVAIPESNSLAEVIGETFIEPIYGTEAKWIQEKDVAQAETLGYIVMSPVTVLQQHLRAIIENNLSSMISMDNLQHLVDKVAEHNSKLVSVAMANERSLIDLLWVIKQLLEEKVPIVQLGLVLEALSEVQGQPITPMQLLTNVRQKLSPYINKSILELIPPKTPLSIITIDGPIEQALSAGLQPNGAIYLEDEVRMHLISQVNNCVKSLTEMEVPIVFVTTQQLRKPLFHMFKGLSSHAAESLYVLDYSELDNSVQLEMSMKIS